MRRSSLVYLALALNICAITPARSLAREWREGEAQALRVLFVGNSYTYVNDLPWQIRQLALSAREERMLSTEVVGFPGATLADHWLNGEAVQKIRAGRWDYVVLQEQSRVPLDRPEDMRRSSRLLEGEIRAARGKTILFLTWARQDRPADQAVLNDASIRIAGELNARIAPVGMAWQSFHKENPRATLYHQDRSHPSPLGSYIAACVLYSTLYGKSPVGLGRRAVDYFGSGTRRIEFDLAIADAALSQRVAWESVQHLGGVEAR